jgi:putative aldouronate transport system permease protein
MLTNQMNNVMLRETADVLDTYILRVGIRENRFSFAAAAGFFRTIVNFSLVLIANFIANKVDGRGLF